jgi:type III restriction enzyme
MSERFFEKPIINSPYAPPRFHHALDAEGQPIDQPPVEGRRRSELITPVPKSKRQKGKPAAQAALILMDKDGLTTDDVEYNPTPIINEIRQFVEAWRNLKNPQDWNVTPHTARLLQHWRTHDFTSQRPFFCQIEAVETMIWLTEVAPGLGLRGRRFLDHVDGANAQANPELLRLAMKMATGSGKTTVMAMLIAWQTVNAVRQPNARRFSRGFLIVTPGITIKDRLRVLMPSDPDSYYASRQLVPADMEGDIKRAIIVITNYHAFKRRERTEVSRAGRALLQGRGDEKIDTLETEGQMLQRVMPELMGIKNINVINDEAHHCYRERPGGTEGLSGDDKREAERNREAARLWITGIETAKRTIGVRTVYDLSATPFFLRGSGYVEGTLFPWTVSDFSLMDAIECGIVKLPRVPVSDNLPIGDMPVYRNLWEHIGKLMPKKGSAKSGELDPLSLPTQLQTALDALYGHYAKTSEAWAEAKISVPPVFIVVCNNTATSKLVYEFISGFTRTDENGKESFHNGRLELFRNFSDYGDRLPRPRTLLIDSEQLESDEALDPEFRAAASVEIEQFKRDLVQREGAQAAEKVTDKDLLREVMNTVGKSGRLGEQIRCVVSVSMLTEGWDTNTVTHVLGVRAFGTQLLCEQVVGRALRRQSYDLNESGMFNPEYADILGIPFDFTAKPVVVKPAAPRETVSVRAMPERAALEITFPRVSGYRVELPNDRVTATFGPDHVLHLTPELVGPCTVLLEGIVGEGVTLDVKHLGTIRPSTVAFNLAKHLLYKHFRDPGEEPKLHLFGQLKTIARRWLDTCLQCAGGTFPAQLMYQEMADQAAERIYLACQAGQTGERRMKAILDPYNPEGSSVHVNFNTSKELRYVTAPDRCHVNLVICDSEWEAEFARVAEAHPRVLAYVKNQGLGLEVPYRDGAMPRQYRPDFILRVDDGQRDPLNLIVEIKGYRRSDAQLKAETMRALWVPGVNNLERYGRWAFAEFHHLFEIERHFGELIDGIALDKAAA